MTSSTIRCRGVSPAASGGPSGISCTAASSLTGTSALVGNRSRSPECLSDGGCTLAGSNRCFKQVFENMLGVSWTASPRGCTNRTGVRIEQAFEPGSVFAQPSAGGHRWNRSTSRPAPGSACASGSPTGVGSRRSPVSCCWRSRCSRRCPPCTRPPRPAVTGPHPLPVRHRAARSDAVADRPAGGPLRRPARHGGPDPLAQRHRRCHGPGRPAARRPGLTGATRRAVPVIKLDLRRRVRGGRHAGSPGDPLDSVGPRVYGSPTSSSYNTVIRPQIVVFRPQVVHTFSPDPVPRCAPDRGGPACTARSAVTPTPASSTRGPPTTARRSGAAGSARSAAGGSPRSRRPA